MSRGPSASAGARDHGLECFRRESVGVAPRGSAISMKPSRFSTESPHASHYGHGSASRIPQTQTKSSSDQMGAIRGSILLGVSTIVLLAAAVGLVRVTLRWTRPLAVAFAIDAFLLWPMFPAYFVLR